MNAGPAGDTIHRLANDQYELLVSAETGRVCRYGKIGGPNVLWDNPHAPETPVVFPGWVNWGGDKVWIWPEEDWKVWKTGHQHPPGDPSSKPHQMEVKGLQLRMTSPVIAQYGLRVVREITLAAQGSEVTFVNRLEQVEKPALTRPVGVWTVTQIPAAREIYARLCPGAKAPGYESFPQTDWPKAELHGRVITFHRPAAPWQKVGIEADLLAIPVGGQMFTVETPLAKNAAGPYAPLRRAQLFSDPDVSDFRLPSSPTYIEFEFTSPMKALAVGESVELTVTWKLSPAGDIPK
jgi:hypothetical protein